MKLTKLAKRKSPKPHETYQNNIYKSHCQKLLCAGNIQKLQPLFKSTSTTNIGKIQPLSKANEF